MIVNLTPHPLHFYPFDCPDRIEPGSVQPLFTIQPAGQTARLAEETGPEGFELEVAGSKVRVESVDYGSLGGVPPMDGQIPHETFYVVSLPAALAATHRTDLLVPYREVRALNGTVIGCRQLAWPC